MAQNNENFSLTSIQDYLTFSKTDVWVWFRLPDSQYEFITDEDKTIKADEFSLMLNNLVKNEDKNVECQIIKTSRPLDTEIWLQNVYKRINKNNPIPYSKHYYEGMKRHLDNSEFEESIVLLAVNLGKRINYNSNARKEITKISFLDDFIYHLSGSPVRDYVSDAEVNYWKGLASQIVNSMKYSRMGTPTASATDIAFSIIRNFYPEISLPSNSYLNSTDAEVWGEGEVASLVDAEIKNGPKFLEITQETERGSETGYRATLCFSKFPEILNYPEGDPWIHVASFLPFTVDFSLRFTLEPARKVRKETDKLTKRHVDQALNEQQAGDVSDKVSEQIQLGRDLKYLLDKDNTPWVYGWYRVTVTATSEEELKDRVTQLVDHYKRLDLILTWSTGDQLNLLKESLPNDKPRIKSYYQRQELSIIGGGVPSGSGTVGDLGSTQQANKLGLFGPYIGETFGSTRTPVFNSPLIAPANNNPPVTTIIGESGSGKTFLAYLAAYQATLEGAWGIFIDPKGEAGQLANLPGLENRTSLIDLATGDEGILDPFIVGATPAEARNLALEVCTIFAGGSEGLSGKAYSALAFAIDNALNQPDPSLTRVIGILGAYKDNEDAIKLASTLSFASKLPFARLCFASGAKAKRLRADAGLMVITIAGLELPQIGKAVSELTNPERLAIAIMYLLTSFTKELMQTADKHHPKFITIDEAWMVTANAQGAKLINEVTRMGRSRYCALTLISQSAGDFDDIVAANTTTKFAFKTRGKTAIKKLFEFFEIEEGDMNTDYVRNLGRGTCIMKDGSDRVAGVEIDTSWAPAIYEGLLTSAVSDKT